MARPSAVATAESEGPSSARVSAFAAAATLVRSAPDAGSRRSSSFARMSAAIRRVGPSGPDDGAGEGGDGGTRSMSLRASNIAGRNSRGRSEVIALSRWAATADSSRARTSGAPSSRSRSARSRARAFSRSREVIGGSVDCSAAAPGSATAERCGVVCSARRPWNAVSASACESERRPSLRAASRKAVIDFRETREPAESVPSFGSRALFMARTYLRRHACDIGDVPHPSALLRPSFGRRRSCGKESRVEILARAAPPEPKSQPATIGFGLETWDLGPGT